MLRHQRVCYFYMYFYKLSQNYQIFKMGQQFSSISQTNRLYQMPLSDYGLKQRINSALSMWKLKTPPFEELLQSRMVVNSHDQLSRIYQIFTMRLSHLYLPATKYLTCQQYGIKGCGQYYKGNIYFQSSIATLSVINDIPFFDSLHIYSVALKGFEILYKKFGYFDVFEDMFYICSNGRVKVWCNSQIYKLNPQSYVLDANGKQEDMLLRIINIIDQNVDKADKLNFKQILYQNIPHGTHLATFSSANMLIRRICKQNSWQPPQRLKCIAHLTREDVQNLLYQQQKAKIAKNSKQNIAQIQNMLTMNTLNNQQVKSKKQFEPGNTSIRLPISTENRFQHYNISSYSKVNGIHPQNVHKNNNQTNNYTQNRPGGPSSPPHNRDQMYVYEMKSNTNHLADDKRQGRNQLTTQIYSKEKPTNNRQMIYHIPLRGSDSLLKLNTKVGPSIIGGPVRNIGPQFVGLNHRSAYNEQQKHIVPQHIIRIVPQVVMSKSTQGYQDRSLDRKSQTEIIQRITIQKRQQKEQQTINKSIRNKNIWVQYKQKQIESNKEQKSNKVAIRKEELMSLHSIKGNNENRILFEKKKTIDQFIVDGVKNSIEATTHSTQEFDQIQKPRVQQNSISGQSQPKGNKPKIQMYLGGVDRINTLPKHVVSRHEYNSGQTIQEFHPFKQLTENSSTQDLSQKYSPQYNDNNNSEYTNPRFFDMLNINRSRQRRNVEEVTRKQSDMCFSFSNKNLESSNGDIESQRWSKKWKDYNEIRDQKKSTEYRQSSLQSNKKKYEVSIDSDIWKDLLSLKKSKETN